MLMPASTETYTTPWGFALPVRNPTHCFGERMKPNEHDLADAHTDIHSPTDSIEAQLDFFRKLGYSPAQVCSALLRLGANPDTNMILGELVRSGASPDGSERVLTPTGLPSMAKSPAKTLCSPASSHEEPCEKGDDLRPIVIDGSNVAMSHGNREVFSCLGIQLAVNYFLLRGHTDITVFVPSWRKEQPRPDVPITDQPILRELERKKIVVFTPSRRVAGKRVACYDDRFIVRLAYESNGIIVSNDTYRDLQGERQEWKRFIEERLLMFSFVNDKFMPPDDPLGRHGPTLDNFLRKVPVLARKQQCPYGKKCTYGLKCKFYHPERANQSSRSLADELREKARVSSPSPGETAGGPGPGGALEEGLTLEQSPDSLKKSHTNGNVVLGKGNHRSNRKPASRRDRGSPQTQAETYAGGHQECLDSGLGSLESQASWEHAERSGAGYRSLQSWPSGRQSYCLPSGPACSCCCSASPSQGDRGGFQPHIQPHTAGGTVAPYSPDGTFCPPQHARYKAHLYPGGMCAYSQPNDFQLSAAPQQGYWSDPYGANPLAYSDPGVEQAAWRQPHNSQLSPTREDRSWGPPQNSQHTPAREDRGWGPPQNSQLSPTREDRGWGPPQNSQHTPAREDRGWGPPQNSQLSPTREDRSWGPPQNSQHTPARENRGWGPPQNSQLSPTREDRGWGPPQNSQHTPAREDRGWGPPQNSQHTPAREDRGWGPPQNSQHTPAREDRGWGPPQNSQHTPAREDRGRGPPQNSQYTPAREERMAVRKKLMSIFNGHLVSTVMDMFPQVMDPQTLAAEIVSLQSQGL